MRQIKFSVLILITFTVTTLAKSIQDIYNEARILGEPTSSESQETSTTGNITGSSVAQELGVSEDFLHKLKENWNKAVVQEQDKQKDQYRQGGGIGEFFGLGGGNAGGGGGGGGGGGEDAEGGDDEDEEAGPTPAPGPGAAGVLTGLFGIFSGLGSLNPMRVIQSTVNFFPPNQREAAQMALDGAFGLNRNGSTTLPPLTTAVPRRRNDTRRPVDVFTVAPLVPSTPASEPMSVSSSAAPKVETTTRKKVQLTQASLWEDFANAAIQLNPKPVEMPVEKPRLSEIEKEFAQTGEKFNFPSHNKLKETTTEQQNPMDEMQMATANLTSSSVNETVIAEGAVPNSGNISEIQETESPPLMTTDSWTIVIYAENGTADSSTA